MSTNNAKKSGEKSTGKIVLIFVAILIGSMFLGAFGAMSTKSLAGNEGAMNGLREFGKMIVGIMPVITLSFNVIMAIIAFSMYGKGKSMFKAWNQEDEEYIERVEDILTIPLKASTYAMIINFLLFAINTSYIFDGSFSKMDGGKAGIRFMVSIAIFILAMVWIIINQGITVKLVKKINPEKKGNILDTKFNKVWIDSCDEAEKLIIYKAGYDAYKANNVVIMVLWCVTFLLNASFNTGIFPIFIVIVIWFAQTVAYMRAARKYEKGEK